jgi:hypothetical protein
LARYEQWDSARRVLLHSIRVSPTASAWHNLAVVHERLGERELANLARREMQLLANPAPSTASAVDQPRVRWLTPEEFAKIAPPEVPTLAAPPQRTPPSVPEKAAARKPWSWFK